MSIVSQSVIDREQLILSHLAQVRSLAAHIYQRCPREVDLEDLISAGTVGLIQAADRYDSRRNVKFRTLADYRIRGAILDHLRQLDPLPRSVRRFQRRREIVSTRLQERLGHIPSQIEVAAELRIPIAKYRRLDRTACAGTPVRMDAFRTEFIEDRADQGQSLVSIEEAILRRQVSDVIDLLPARQKCVLKTFLRGATLHEIAIELGVNESRVSQIKSAAISHVRYILRR
jgi:RNA polymerase sigma factor for flagellar operon FliA